MKRLLFLICFSLICKLSYSQEKDIKGTLIVYYTQKSDTLIGDYYTGYCLDSIRLVVNKKSIPVGYYYLSNELFLYVPTKKIDNISTFLGETSLFSTNNGKNMQIHQGGDIYKRKNAGERLYIAFNFKGKGFEVIPELNSIRKDNIYNIVEKSINPEVGSGIEEKVGPGIELCSYTVNETGYIIIQKNYIATPLSKRQRKKLGFTHSDLREFNNYGVL